MSFVTKTRGQMTKRPHRCHTWTVQSYLLGGANVHPHLTHASLGHRSPYPRWHLGSAVFAQLMAAESPYTLQWAVPFPSKLPPHMGISGPPSKTWFLGPTRVHAPNSTSINSVVFAGLKIMTDRQTDRQATLLCLQQ